MRLQKAPLGLLALFSLKDLGRNPPEFAEFVQPTADVTDHYSLSDLTRTAIAANVTNEGDTFGGAVPDGEVWRVRCIDAALTLAAATTAAAGVAFALGIALQGNAATQFAAFDGGTTALGAHGANRTFRCSTGWLARPLLLGSGGTFTFFNSAAYSAASSGAMSILFERFRV